MDVSVYGVLVVVGVLIIALGTFIWGMAVGDEHGGGHNKNTNIQSISIVVSVVAFFGFLFMLAGSSLHGSIGNVAHDPLVEGRYYVVSSAEWDENTLALVLVELKGDISSRDFSNTRPRFHLVEQDCFRSSPVPQPGDRLEVVKTRNSRFCETTPALSP